MGSDKTGNGFRTFDFSNVREDPFNRIHSAVLRNGEPFDVTSVDIPPDEFYDHSPGQGEPDEEIPAPAASAKIHPLLAQWVDSPSGHERKHIIINLVDNLTMPPFPEPAAEENADSLTNQHVRAQNQILIDDIKAQRKAGYSNLAADLTANFNAVVLEFYWLIRGVLVDMPLSSVKALSERDEVLYIEPRYAGTKPPASLNPSDDVADGRASVNSDPYLRLGLSGGFVGLLDTGVRHTHRLLLPPTKIRHRRDCVNGGATCDAEANPDFDPTDTWDHGTASAAILAGNANFGPEFRGVTDVTLDSFKVFTDDQLDTAAACRAFEAAIRVGDRVIMANIAARGAEIDAVCTAANKAFGRGAVVIAANGDDGTSAGSVNGPARASKVIGVGAFELPNGNLYRFQSCGPAPGGRIKPDLQAPTNAETASTADETSDTALAIFGGTSGAAPFGAAAAVLLRNWLRRTSGSIDPGQVYAFLILSGQQPRFDNTNGAGPIRLPTNGWASWGKVRIGPDETCAIPIDIDIPASESAQATMFDGALWWPQEPSKSRNNIELYIVDPMGRIRAKSNSRFSVFQRARWQGAMTNGKWHLVIHGDYVREEQTVYWATMVHSNTPPSSEAHALPG